MAQFHSLLTFLILALASQVFAQSSGLLSRWCSSIDIRKEWRDMTTAQRISYTGAVKCLHNLPSALPARGATSRFDDFQLTHVLLTPEYHFVGQFLPWHRHLVTIYTKALRDECGYSGPTPYWDWTRDAAASVPFAQSPIFDPVTGFGGDGVSGTYTLPADPNNELEIPPFDGHPDRDVLWKGCVQDGPFRDTEFTLHFGPGRMKTDHCIVRSFNPTNWTSLILEAKESEVLGSANFEQFRKALDFGGPHLGGHAIVGGDLSNTFSSPGDPLFYLHHANVARLWWQWQWQNPWHRLYDISGATQYGGSVQVTLDYPLTYPALGENITIGDVMNTFIGPNCYSYDS